MKRQRLTLITVAFLAFTTFALHDAQAQSDAQSNGDQAVNVTDSAPATQPIYTLPLNKVKYVKGYPSIPKALHEADAARQAQWDALDDAAWHAAEPDVAKAAVNGKPYIPLALDPADLPRAKIPAFPGAEGGGMYTTGGRGGRIFVVTSLADSGPGTFRQACEAGGPRTVVFNVAGIIHLDRPIEIRAPYLTIAGQSAPGDGVCVAGRTTDVETHDVIIRYLRFRRGITELVNRDDALGGDPIGNVIIDHVSASWGNDETLSMYRQMYAVVPGEKGKRLKLPVMNLTIQWTIISEGLDTYHHAFGATWGGRDTLFSHNLFACDTGRNASIGMGYDFNFVNNVIFNWRHRTLDGGDETSLVNVINNYYKPGPATNDSPVKYRVFLPQPMRTKATTRPFGKYYVAGNVVEGNDQVTADNWNGGVQFPASVEHPDEAETDIEITRKIADGVRVERPLPMPQATIQSAQDAYASVLDQGGATLPVRDPVDNRVIKEVRSGEVTYAAGKGIITDISQVGGYPDYKGTPFAYDVGDGIPDWWKTKYGLKLHDPSVANADNTGDGYTNLEKYLNGLDPTQKVDWTDLKNNINTLAHEKLFGQ